MAIPENTLDRVKIPGVTTPYEIAARYIMSNYSAQTEYHTWEDILNAIKTSFTVVAPWTKADYQSTSEPSATKLAEVPKDVEVYYKNGDLYKTGTLPADGEETKKHIYLIYHPHQTIHGGDVKDNFDEYISVGTGTSSTWEKIGNTDINLNDYVKKGLYTDVVTNPDTDATGAAGGFTVNTSSTSLSPTVSGTVKYDKVNSYTLNAGGATTSNTSQQASVTITPELHFTGTTKSDIGVSFNKTSVTVGDHAAKTITVSGSQDLSHKHTVSLSGVSHTNRKWMDWEHIEVGGGTLTSQGAQTVVTGVNTTPVTVVTGASMWQPTVNSGILSFESVAAPIAQTTINAFSSAPTATVQKGYNFTAATITSTEVTPTAYDFMQWKENIETNSSSISVAGNNFSVSIPTLSHSIDTEFSASVSITPEGTISGDVVVPAHSHTYVYLPLHSHATDVTSTDATVNLTVTVPNHTHSVTVGNHTHSMNHTHNLNFQ